MSRRRRKTEIGSLDSLLDTMTNVVGILVILLVVTQLNVADAVKRVLRAEQDIPVVSRRQLALAEKKANQQEQEINQLLRQWNQKKKHLPELRRRLDETQQRIAGLQKQLSEPTEPDKFKQKVEKLLTQRKNEINKLTEQIGKLDQQEDRIQTQLAEVAKVKAPPPKIVTLPNPRPAPKGARPVLFLCREGRLYHVSYDNVKKVVSAIVRHCFPNRSDKTAPVDCKVLAEYFQNHNLGTNDFRYTVEPHWRGVQVVLNRKRGGGETINRIQMPHSLFQRVLRHTDKDKRYVRFVVWPDSFELYVRARRVSDEYSLAAGWVPTTRDKWTIIVWQYKCKGVKPPKPKPESGSDKKSRPPQLPID